MKTIHRYIFKECFYYFLVTLLIFTSLLLSARILKFTNLIVNKGVELNQILIVFISIIPTFMEIAIPISIMLGVMIGISRLSGDSEVIVLRASGVTLNELLKPVIFLGILTTMICFAISIYLRPWGFRTLSKSLYSIARSSTSSSLNSGVFNKLGKLTIYTSNINHQTGTMDNIIIDDQRSDLNRTINIAPKGAIYSNDKTQTISFILDNGTIYEYQKEDFAITNYLKNSINVSSNELYNPEANKQEIKNKELRLKEINNKEEYISKQDWGIKEKNKLLTSLSIEKHRRFAIPFSALLLAILGLPLGIVQPRTQRTWGASLSILLGISSFIIYFSLFSVGNALAEAKTLPTYIALWIPNLLTVFAVFFIYKKLSTEKWNSVSDGLTNFVNIFRSNK